MGLHAETGARLEPTARPVPLGERMLVDAVQRALRRGRANETLALVLHLSRLLRPAPLPHHHRIARAILQDVAQQRDGQVFPMANGDLVLVCRQLADGSAEAVSLLTQQLSRLFRLDAGGSSALIDEWSDENGIQNLLSYAIERLADAEANPLADEPQPGAPAAVEAISALLSNGRIDDLLQRQTGVLMRRVAPSPGLVIRPLYQELTFAGEALAARFQSLGGAEIDPFLFRHLARVLDRRMLDRLSREIDPASPLRVRTSFGAGSPIHLNLTLATILGSDFDRFLDVTEAVLGVEVALIEACGDAAAFATARRKLAGRGITVILDGVSDLALQLAQPWAFEADLVKIDWSPRLAAVEAGELQRIDRALERLDPSRLILQRAESEGAVRWGLANGIQRFQGRHVDAMLGAGRLSTCSRAVGCTLRQCVERSASLSRAGRAGCGNLVLLDAGLADEAALSAA